jgi:hypothetical protein
MLPESIIYIGVIASLIGVIWYLKSIIHGQVKPNLVSWFIWTLAPFLAVFFQIKAGAGLSILPVFMAGFGPLLVVVFSFFRKDAYWKLNTFDIICGAFSLVALILYIFTHNLGISIFFAILSDGLAAIPTIVKSWKFPETESSVAYTTGMFSNILALLIIKNWIFTIYSFSIYNIIINLALVSCIYRKKIFKS